MQPIARLLLAAVLLLAACARHVESSHALVSPRVWPVAKVAGTSAPPEILAVDLSPTHVTRGAWWSGRIATSTNVASLEVRWPFFTFAAPRRSSGQFVFRFHVIDLPAIYRRPYTVEIVARNTPGESTQKNVVVDFR